MVKRFVLLILGIIVIAGNVRSQYDNWLNYTGCTQICSIVPYNDDILFGGHGSGLFSYDGNERVIYNKANSGLINNIITCMATDDNGGVWIGSSVYAFSNFSGGLSYFNGSDWETYTTENFGIPSNEVQALAIDIQARLWVGTYDGLGVYDGNSWVYYNSSNSPVSDGILDIEIAEDGTVWVGTYDGLAKYDGNNWEVFTNENSPLLSNEIRDVEIDNNGNIWLGTRDGGLTRIDEFGIGVTYTESNSGLPRNFINAIFCDNNSVWLAMNSGGGIVLFEDPNWTVYTKENSGLSSNYYNSIYVDVDDIVWAGSTYRGVESYDGSNWQSNFDFFGEIQSNTVREIRFGNDSRVWFATDEGLSIKDGESWQYYDKYNSILKRSYITSVALEQNNNFWIANGTGGLYYHNGIELIDYTSTNPIFDDEYIELIEMNGDELWAVTYGVGPSVYNGLEWTNYNENNTGCYLDFVDSFAFGTDSTVWIGTNRGLVARYNDNTWEEWSSNNSDLPYGHIFDIVIDESGNKWLGGSEGLFMFDGDNFIFFDTISSLIEEKEIYSLAIDEAGKLWLGTGCGLIIYDGVNWELIDNNNSGLSGSLLLDIEVDAFGNKWISTKLNGAAVYNENGIITGIETKRKKTKNSLFNFPNPFTDNTTIKYTLELESRTRFYIYDQNGKLQTVIDEGVKSKGNHELRLNTSNYAPGLYVCQIITPDFHDSIRIIKTGNP